MKDGRRVSDKIQARLSQRDDQFMWSLGKPRPLICCPSFSHSKRVIHNISDKKNNKGGVQRNLCFIGMCSSLGRRTCHRGIVLTVLQFTQNELIDGYDDEDRDDNVIEKSAFFGHRPHKGGGGAHHT